MHQMLHLLRLLEATREQRQRQGVGLSSAPVGARLLEQQLVADARILAAQCFDGGAVHHRADGIQRRLQRNIPDCFFGWVSFSVGMELSRA